MSQILRSCAVSFFALLCLACQSPSDDQTPAVTTSNAAVDLKTALPEAPDANILIVSFDALRADALGTYGYSRDTSPNIDRFAREAVVFDRAYSAAPVTPTSFAAAFSGQLPIRSFQEWKMVAPKTLASAMTNAGYSTAAMLNNSQVTDERFFNQGFVEYQYYDAISDDQVLENGIRWLLEHKDEKFFFWLHFLTPHSPYEYRSTSQQFYEADYEGEFKTTTTGSFDTDDPGEIRRIRDLYDGEVFYGDQLFGQLIDFLEAQGLLENTIVVLTADHGEEFKERGRFQHRYMHEETVRVPLLIRHPQATGTRTDTLYSNVDLWPTLAAMVGSKPPDQGDGWNLLAPSDNERAFVTVAMTDQHYRGLSLHRGDEKLILSCVPEVKAELFELTTDPGEVNDLAESETSRVRDLLQMLRLVTGTEDPCLAIEEALAGQDPTSGLSEETIESLRALGYLQ